MIEGLTQGILYGSSSHRIYTRLRRDGADVTSITGSATITIYNPSGTQVLAAANMTQVTSTAVFYYALNASSTTTFELGMNYRCKINFTASSIAQEDHFFVDVVKYPFNEPLLTDTEIDEIHPAWNGNYPGGWTDWTQAIEQAHLELCKELRSMRDGRGKHVYPHMILDRSQLRLAELALVERVIAEELRLRDEDLDYYRKRAENAIPTILTLDLDDDLTVDADEDQGVGPSFVR